MIRICVSKQEMEDFVQELKRKNIKYRIEKNDISTLWIRNKKIKYFIHYDENH